MVSPGVDMRLLLQAVKFQRANRLLLWQTICMDRRDTQMDIRSILQTLCEAFNAHDLDRIMDFFAEDCTLEMPRGGEPWGTRFQGRRDVRNALASRFQGIPDVHYGNARHFVDASANTGISKWTLTGTTSDGRQIEVRGCDFYTFRDGKVVSKDSYWKIVE